MLGSGVEAEYSCHSFTSTNPNLTIKPWCAEAATLPGPGKASSVTWLHQSVPNETTQQKKLLENTVHLVQELASDQGAENHERQRQTGVDLITLFTFYIYNILVCLDGCLQVFLTCSRGEFPFQLSCFDVRQEKHLRDNKCFNWELLVHLHGKNIKSPISWLSTAAAEKLSAVNVCGS